MEKREKDEEKKKRNGKGGLVIHKYDQSHHGAIGALPLCDEGCCYERGQRALLFPNTALKRHQLRLTEGGRRANLSTANTRKQMNIWIWNHRWSLNIHRNLKGRFLIRTICI